MAEILGVQIANLSKKEVQKKIKEFLNQKGFYYLVTINPEFLLLAQKDEEFFHILNKANLAVADGIGLLIVGRLLGEKIKERITGVDLTAWLLKEAEKNNWKVGIVVWEKGIAKPAEIEKFLKEKYPSLNFLVLASSKSNFSLPALETFSPQILLVGLGAPYQEKFLYFWQQKKKSNGVGLGIGGAFDFLTGKARRAPKVCQKLGLEWLWRLFFHPFTSFSQRWERCRRIGRAVIVFPFLALKQKYLHPFFYRSNVACLLYKKENGHYYFYLAERADEKGHWQLPQGGRDKEKIAVAAQRELSEELGIKEDKLKVRKVFPHVYAYKYYHYQGNKNRNYKGQKQSLAIVEFLGKDEDIRLFPYDFQQGKWVREEEALKVIHPIRKEGFKIFLSCWQKFLRWQKK